MLVKRYLGMEDPRKEKGKATKYSYQRIVRLLPVLQIKNSDTRNKSLEDDPMKLHLLGHVSTISFLDGTKDVKVTSSIVPPLLIVNSDSRFRIEINKHEDPDGTQGFLLVLQILAQEDKKMHLFVEDATYVDVWIVTPGFIGMIALHHPHLKIR